MADPTPQDTHSTNGTSGDQLHETASTAKQNATTVVGQAKQQASSLLDQAKNKVITVAATQKDGLATQLDEFAKSVHKSGEQFSGEQEWIADAIERGAVELNSLAASLRDNDVASLIKEVKSVAQRKPALFVGICLAGGLALARVGKLVAADLSREDLPSMPEVGHGGK